ncbi:MAG: pur operon repressor [Clostridiaceae bacterium]
MEKLSRNSRVVAITKLLMENPNRIIGLNNFSDLLNAAKSTISEDIVIVREVLEKLGMGRIETISGASGGIKFINGINAESRVKFGEKLCELLKDPSRIVPGNFIYMTDLMFNPQIIGKAGVILASALGNRKVNCVVTVETKGIPLAYEVAKNLGIELVIARRDNNRVTEGSTITINYVSGSSGKIQQMSLSKKSLKKGSRCLFIDDFLKGGGTAKGIEDLLNEFDSELAGIGVLVDHIGIEKKLIKEYVSIIELESVGNNGVAELKPSKLLI